MSQKTFMILTAIIIICMALAGPTFGAKTIIFIRNSGNAQYLTHDVTMIKALGTTGVVVGTVTVPGLSYTIMEVQQGADADTYTAADGDLIFVSQTVGSNSTKQHSDDPLPLIMSEQANFDDSGGTDVDDMWFSDTSGGVVDNVFNITTSHPITRIFPLGPLQAWTLITGNQMGVGQSLGTGVTALANRVSVPTDYCLMVMDQGASGLRPGAPAGFEPTPGRRVCLGFQQNGMSVPTVEGIYLLQRTVQWAIGDQVNAGEPERPTTPTAPTNLTAQAGDGCVRLSWSAASGEVTGYRVLQSQTSGGPYSEATSVTGAVPRCDVTGLQNGTQYYFVVRAFNSAGDGPNSNEVSATPWPGISLEARNWRDYK